MRLRLVRQCSPFVQNPLAHHRSGFKRSEYSIINGDRVGEFPVERTLRLLDKEGRALNLRLNYLLVLLLIVLSYYI